MTSKEIRCSTIINATQSWDRVKSKSDNAVTGELILARLFELRPSAKKIFRSRYNYNGIRSNASFRIHAQNMVDMIDRAVSYLGPDMEVFEKELIALGRRHMRVGVQAEDLEYMGCAVQFALEYVLGGEFTTKERLAWAEVLAFMIEKMTVGMLDF